MSSRALVIGITRLGDLIQSEPLIRALRSHAGFNSVDLLIERSFVEIASELSFVDDIVCIDFEDTLRPLSVRSDRLPLEAFARIVKRIDTAQYDRVFNLTHSRPSMVLAALASRGSEGVTLDESGYQVVRNSWLRYFFATNLARPWCAFNLVDIYVNAVAPRMPFIDRIPRLRKPLDREIDSRSYTNTPHVLLHLTASQSDKQWPQPMFDALTSMLIDRGAEVTLVGNASKDNDHRGLTNRRVNNLIGKTSIRDLIELCDSADLMVTADSGPAHVAACRRLPVVAIEGGSAHAFETAPYGIANLVIEPHLENVVHRIPDKRSTSAPASRVSVLTVLSAAERLLCQGESIVGSEGCTVYETASGTYVPGVELRPINGSHFEYEKWQSDLRKFWYNALTGDPDGKTPPSGRFSKLFDRVVDTCKQIEKVGSDSPLLTAASRNLTKAEQELDGELLKHPPLHHVVAYLKIARSSLSGTNVSGQAQELRHLYQSLSMAGKCLEELPEARTINVTRHNNPMEATA